MFLFLSIFPHSAMCGIRSYALEFTSIFMFRNDAAIDTCVICIRKNMCSVLFAALFCFVFSPAYSGDVHLA